MDIEDLRTFLFDNFNEVAQDGINLARENKVPEEDISAALLVEYLLGAATTAMVNELSVQEFVLLARDAYARMFAETKNYVAKKAEEKQAAPGEPANVVPFVSANTKRLH